MNGIDERVEIEYVEEVSRKVLAVQNYGHPPEKDSIVVMEDGSCYKVFHVIRHIRTVQQHGRPDRVCSFSTSVNVGRIS